MYGCCSNDTGFARRGPRRDDLYGGFPWGWNEWDWPGSGSPWSYPEVWGTGPYYDDWPFDPNYGYPIMLSEQQEFFHPMLGYPVLPPWVAF
jgi:hypothetical protein